MKSCLFCDRKANRLEHAWPQWMLAVLGSLTRVEVEFADGRRGVWRAPLQIKCVCCDCNSGWMSNLETRCRWLLGAMMADVSLRLDRAQQHLIAAWCIKTAMVFEATNPTKSYFYTKAEREHLRLTLTLPAGTLLWLGRQHRSNFTYCHARKLGMARPENKLILTEGYVTTFAVARLVMQIITARTNPEYRGRVTPNPAPGPWNNHGLIQAWPATPSISWPPAWSFGEPDLDTLSGRFRNPS